MMEHPALVIRYSLYTAAMLATLVAWWLVPRPRPRLYNWLAGLTALAVAMESVGFYLHLNAVLNAGMYNVFVVVESVVLLRMVLLVRPGWRNVLGAVALACVGAMAWAAAVRDGSTFLLTEGIVVVDLLLTAVLLAVLWHLATTSERPLPQVPEFWYFLGLLIYFGGMVPLIGLLRTVYAQDERLASRLYFIVGLLCVVRYVLSTVACRKVARDRNQPA